MAPNYYNRKKRREKKRKRRKGRTIQCHLAPVPLKRKGRHLLKTLVARGGRGEKGFSSEAVVGGKREKKGLYEFNRPGGGRGGKEKGRAMTTISRLLIGKKKRGKGKGCGQVPAKRKRGGGKPSFSRGKRKKKKKKRRNSWRLPSGGRKKKEGEKCPMILAVFSPLKRKKRGEKRRRFSSVRVDEAQTEKKKKGKKWRGPR